MSKRKSQIEHDHLVEMLGNSLYAYNRNLKLEDLSDIRADVDGFKRPDKITLAEGEEGDTPDATAMGEQFLIYEVETPDSIAHEHTEKQWKLFAKYAEENNGVFTLGVPPMAMGDARRRLKELSITAKVMPLP